MLENLFETERCEGARNGFDGNEAFYEPSKETAQECLNVDHTGMSSTRETTHEDKRPCPGESYLPCKTVISNIDSLQSGICGTNDDRELMVATRDKQKIMIMDNRVVLIMLA